jgi:hypothetical protein
MACRVRPGRTHQPETINATDRLRSSSASQRGIEQTHDEVDQRILEELKGRVYYDVGDFYERYFEGKPWINNAGDIHEESRAHYTEGRWSGWREPSIQSQIFFFFFFFWSGS